jgi:hypothetical protein
LLSANTTGDRARRHQQIATELARDFTDNLPVATSEEIRRRPMFRNLDR